MILFICTGILIRARSGDYDAAKEAITDADS